MLSVSVNHLSHVADQAQYNPKEMGIDPLVRATEAASSAPGQASISGFFKSTSGIGSETEVVDFQSTTRPFMDGLAVSAADPHSESSATKYTTFLPDGYACAHASVDLQRCSITVPKLDGSSTDACTISAPLKTAVVTDNKDPDRLY